MNDTYMTKNGKFFNVNATGEVTEVQNPFSTPKEKIKRKPGLSKLGIGWTIVIFVLLSFILIVLDDIGGIWFSFLINIGFLFLIIWMYKKKLSSNYIEFAMVTEPAITLAKEGNCAFLTFDYVNAVMDSALMAAVKVRLLNTDEFGQRMMDTANGEKFIMEISPAQVGGSLMVKRAAIAIPFNFDVHEYISEKVILAYALTVTKQNAKREIWYSTAIVTL